MPFPTTEGTSVIINYPSSVPVRIINKGDHVLQTLELETMRSELEGHLGRLRLNRPQALNAANWAWVEDLVTATRKSVYAHPSIKQ